MISIFISGNRSRHPPASPRRGSWWRTPGPSKAAPLMNSDFKELLTILNDCEVRYLVVGGYAYIHYAEPRYTKDIDLWIEPTPENALRLREALVRFGGWVDGMTLEHFTTERTMFQIGLPPCRVDFLTSIPALISVARTRPARPPTLRASPFPSSPLPISSPPNVPPVANRTCATSPVWSGSWVGRNERAARPEVSNSRVEDRAANSRLASRLKLCQFIFLSRQLTLYHPRTGPRSRRRW